MVVTKQQFNKKIGEFIEPKFTIRYIKNSELVECKALCDLRNLKVSKPPKEPDMAAGNLTIQKLTNIISKVFWWKKSTYSRWNFSNKTKKGC